MGLKAASIATSPRLQRVLAVLKDGEEHTTRDIVRRASVCAVNSCVAELRANGYRISCQRRNATWRYRLTEHGRT